MNKENRTLIELAEMANEIMHRLDLDNVQLIFDRSRVKVCLVQYREAGKIRAMGEYQLSDLGKIPGWKTEILERVKMPE